VLAVGALTLLALALRAVALDESFFGDELFTHLISTRPDLQAVMAGVRSELEISPPLYFVVAWLFGKLGDPFVWLRIPSLLAGVATVPLVYVLGVRTVGRAGALVASALFALSPFAIFYSSEARAYALMTLLVVLSTLSLLRALETNDRRWWAAFALLQAASMYTHYTAVFVLAAQGLWALLAYPARRVPVLVSSGAAALLFAPWVPLMIDDSNAPNQRIIGAFEPFGPRTVARNTGRLIDGGPFAPLTDLPGTPALVMLGLATLIGVAGLVWALRRARTRPPLAGGPVLIGLLALAAPVGASLYSAVSDDLYVARNLISSLPYLALALGALLTALPRRVAAPALALALAALAIGGFGTLETDTQRPNYTEAAELVEAKARPGDVVLDLNPFPGPPSNALDVHLAPGMRVFKLGYPGQEQRAVRAAGRSGGRILYVRPEIGVVRGAVPESVARGYREVSAETWSGWFPLTVAVFEPRG
jgi:4-amino-4-deoxy-L-arabinose transferase-like glycosyltransferase